MVRRNKAIFLDRDGVINDKIENVSSPEEFKLLPNTLKGLKLLSSLDYKLIITTNQIGISRGLLSLRDYYQVNKKMVRLFRGNSIRIDAIYFCTKSEKCRKPNITMMKKAEKRFNLDLKDSFLIGDKTSDIFAGMRAGCTTILVKTGAGGKDKKYDVKPDYIVDDLYVAAKLISKISERRI